MPVFLFSLLQTKPKYACSIRLWQKQWIISLRLSNRVAVVLTKIVINNCLLKNAFISLSLVATPPPKKTSAHKSKARPFVFIPPRYLVRIMQLSGLWGHPGGWKTMGLWPEHSAVWALSQDPQRLSQSGALCGEFLWYEETPKDLRLIQFETLDWQS